MSRCESSFDGYVRNGNLSKRRFIDDGVVDHFFSLPSALADFSGAGESSALKVLPFCDMASSPICSTGQLIFLVAVQIPLIKLVW